MQLLLHWSSDWVVLCKIRSYMILKITGCPALILLRTLHSCLVSLRDACPCIDGMNWTPSSRILGNINFPLLACFDFFICNLDHFWFYGFGFRAVIIFGLNALSGRSIRPDGSAVGAWDSSNAESLIRYTVKKGYDISAWELGKNAFLLLPVAYRYRHRGRWKLRIPMSFSLWASY